MKKTCILFGALYALSACNNVNKSHQRNDLDTLHHESSLGNTKIDSTELFGKQWSLVELNDSIVVLDTTFPGKPYLEFNANTHTLSGSLGCNGFGTTFELTGNDNMTLSAITATELACPNLKVEQNFLEALNNTKKYELANDTLMLKNTDGKTLAKLRKLLQHLPKRGLAY